MLTAPRDFASFILTLMVTTMIASVVQLSILTLSPALRAARTRGVSFVVQFASTVVLGVVVLVFTPPGTPADDLTVGASIYQFIGLSLLLSLVSIYLGAAFFYLVVMPLTMLFRAITGRRGRVAAGGKEVSSSLEQQSRTELAATGGIILATLGFGVSMYFVLPDTGVTVTRVRMLDQFAALVGFRGDPVASVIAIACVAVIIVLVVVNNRAVRRRRSSDAASRTP